MNFTFNLLSKSFSVRNWKPFWQSKNFCRLWNRASKMRLAACFWSHMKSSSAINTYEIKRETYHFHMAGINYTKSIVRWHCRFNLKDLFYIVVKIIENYLFQFFAVHAVDYNSLVSEDKVPIIFDYYAVSIAQWFIKFWSWVLDRSFIVKFAQFIWRLVSYIGE